MSEHRGKIIVDLDGCLAGPKKPGGGYDSCRPNGRMVQRLRELHALGFKIAIYTSRNVRTHNHNPGRLIADTAPQIIDWLKRHTIPYDEIHVGKPWTGTVGYYVDDRALRPEELLNYTIGELVELTKGGRYDPAGTLGRHGSHQGWVFFSLLNGEEDQVPTALRSGAFVASTERAREAGWRSAALIPTEVVLPLGMDEELHRLGVRVFRCWGPTILFKAVGTALQELVTQGLASAESPALVVPNDCTLVEVEPVESARARVKQTRGAMVKWLTGTGPGLTVAASLLSVPHREPNTAIPMIASVGTRAQTPFNVSPGPENRVLRSRHFNHVVKMGDRVVKTADTTAARVKLAFEASWLHAYEDLTPGDVQDNLTADGYSMRYAPGGSLDKVLLRSSLHQTDIDALCDDIDSLFTKLGTGDVLPRTLDELKDIHTHFIYEKARDRMLDLEGLSLAGDLPDVNEHWIVNGVDLGAPTAVVDQLLDLIPFPSRADWGGWHGDFCPGNMVLELSSRVYECERFNVRLIDPRGTLDGETTAVAGDRRYDAAKLAHALRWGYDTLVEGWRDCDWQYDSDGRWDVHLELWDETLLDGALTNRRRLWDALSQVVSVGGQPLDTSVIHALAALQLITCAPLHSEDPTRVVALVARGLQAAKHALAAHR